VRRRDAFMRSFDNTCMKPGEGADAMQACGRELEARFGFPDPKCAGRGALDQYAQRAGQTLPESPQLRAGKTGAASGATD
jgi:hypothetical protein